MVVPTPIAAPFTAATNGVASDDRAVRNGEAWVGSFVAARDLEILDIVAGGEGIAGAAQQHDADRRILVRVTERLHHGGIHRRGQRVLFLRPVEQHLQHRAGLVTITSLIGFPR